MHRNHSRSGVLIQTYQTLFSKEGDTLWILNCNNTLQKPLFTVLIIIYPHGIYA